MKTRTLSHRFLSMVTLLTLLLPLSPAPSLLARQVPPPSNTEGLVDAAADTCSPSAVVNLVASTGASPGTVELSWVAPGDDATAGTALAYIVRYNTTTITESNWGMSSNVTGEPAPSPAGSVESMFVSGLAPGRTYYFAIKTRDEVPNTSSISNSPAAVAQVGPSAIYLPLVASSASSVPTVIPDTTKVLPETTTQYLSEVSGDGAVFTFMQSTADLDALAPGDVMVGNATANAPYGFLRRVTSVSSSGGQVVVTTEEATLEDAIESGEAHVSQVLTPNQIQGSTQLQGVKLAALSQLDDEWHWTLDKVVLYDHDKNPGTTNDQVVASGSIQLKPSFDFDLVVRDWKLEELYFIAGAVEITKLEIGGEVELLGIEEEKVIAQYTLTPITVPIPPSPFPVVIVPVLTVSVGVDGSVHIGVTTGVEQQATLKAGLRYAGEVWQPVSHFSNEFHYNPPTLSAGLNLKGYASAQLALLLYGVTGPYAELEAYLELAADIADDPWWTLWAGLEMPLGVKVEVLGHTIVETETVPIAYRLALAQATSNTPPNLPSSPFPADGAIIQDLDVNLSWSGGDLDGDSVTYDVYFEANDTTPDTLVSNDQSGTTYDPGTLASSTRYYWRIVAKDNHGATTAGPVWEFITATGETCPINLILRSLHFSDLTVTIDGAVTSTCSTITRLNWQWGDGVGNDQWFPASHTYAVFGTYPITVTAYNDLGDTEVAHTTAYVGTASSDMVIIPAGEFQMGCDDSNPNEYCYSDEQPLHTVYLDAYYIDKYEVTNAQYAEFLNDLGNQEEGGVTWFDTYDKDVHIHQIGGVWQADPGYGDHPAVEMTWYGARAYCQWQGKRLPTEAEWEKAARGDSDTRMYPWGNESPDCSRLNYNTCVGDSMPVGSYPTGASPYGVMDMAGNVYEWVNDWYDSDYYDLSPYSNPPGPASGSYKVLRGGHWRSTSTWDKVRVAWRNYHHAPDGSYSDFGFRCAGAAPGQ